MNTSNAYILAFQGSDKIYVLNDPHSREFKEALEAKFRGSEVEILEGLGARHGAGGLETLSYKDKSGIPKGRVFARRHLDSANLLSDYPSRVMNYGEMRTHLSLLVCMISESARIPMMERDFTAMFYYGYDVWADYAVRSYDNARFLILLATWAFSAYPLALAVEKLQKRSVEMNELLTRIEGIQEVRNRSGIVANLLNARATPNPATANFAQRFRELVEELKLLAFLERLKASGFATPAQMKMANADAVLELINTCKSEGAVRAAKQGVAIPRIGLP
jgi:hypothetical protein